MSTIGEPQDAVPADGGTMQLRAQPEDAAPVPEDARPAEPGTVRLGRSPQADEIATVRLPGGSEVPVATPTVHLPVEPQAVVPTPTVEVPAGATVVEAAGAEVALIRFGPGVPDPKTARTIAVWKGEVVPEPPQERRKRSGWLFWVPVVLLFLALLAWWLYGLLAPAPLKITGASVQVNPTVLSCGGKATVTATVTTDGRAGSFRYRWVRNDGTDSGMLTETVAAGTRQVQLPLIWTLSGPGSFDGKATLEIENHPAFTETAAFTYSCPG
jgi:hypothetical protein